MVGSYEIGRTYRKAFKFMLDSMVAGGECTYTETKGIIICYFHINATQEVHESIINTINIYKNYFRK